MNEQPQGPAGQDIQVQVAPQGLIGEVGPLPHLKPHFPQVKLCFF